MRRVLESTLDSCHEYIINGGEGPEFVLMLALSKLKVREEEHVQSAGVIDFKFVHVGLCLLDLFFWVLHGTLKYIDRLCEHGHI